MAEWDKVEGEIKEGAGKLTGDEGLEGEGKVQGAWGDAKDKAGDAVDSAKEKAGDVADEARERL